MSSVTKRIKEIQQPRGGYVKPSQFEMKIIDDGKALFESENVHASMVGMVVDYLTRFVTGTSIEEAFSISCQGAARASLLGYPNAVYMAYELLSGIKGTDEKSIVNACKIVAFDIWYRNPAAALSSTSTPAKVNLDKNTIWNIQCMVQRATAFWKEYGPILKDGFTFEKNGYTATVDTGDGDYLTANTIWDFKVSKSKPTSKHTLQLLMYWIMGQHSAKKEFMNITKLGIFNPRLNIVYILPISKVSAEVIEDVEKEVICY